MKEGAKGERFIFEPLTNVWDDIPFQGIAREGGVVFSRNKKPEKLIERILEMGEEKLMEIPGIGDKTAAKIMEAARDLFEEVDEDPGAYQLVKELDERRHQAGFDELLEEGDELFDEACVDEGREQGDQLFEEAGIDEGLDEVDEDPGIDELLDEVGQRVEETGVDEGLQQGGKRGEDVDEDSGGHKLFDECGDLLAETERFLRAAHAGGVEAVRIVYGKGRGSPGGRGVLREVIPRWLDGDGQELVQRYERRPDASGADAAVVVWLRHR